MCFLMENFIEKTEIFFMNYSLQNSICASFKITQVQMSTYMCNEYNISTETLIGTESVDLQWLLSRK